MTPRIRTVLLLALAGAVTSTSVVAVGQDREVHGRAEAEAPDTGDDEDDEDAAAAADSEELEEDDGKVKVFRFTGLDISGRLKSPQLLYFLNRLRAEFERPRLPHRSFVPELVRSTKNESMK